MDQIYASAVLTIVACAGKDANAGLPRLHSSQIPDDFQQQVVAPVQGLVLGNVLVDSSIAVDESTWNTRAWTYQERMLSKRLLFFSGPQMYFQCEHGAEFREDAIFEAELPAEVSPAWPNAQIRGMNAVTNTEIYAHAVESYTRRNMTKAEDGLNAMAGINILFDSKFPQQVFVWPSCIGA